MTLSEKDYTDLNLIEYDNSDIHNQSTTNNNESKNTLKSPLKENEERGVEIISIALDLGNGSQAVFTIHEND